MRKAEGLRSQAAGLDHRSHYDHDDVGRPHGYEGAGLLAYMTKDQLHPPMVDDEAVWQDGRRWYEGAIRQVREAAALCDLDWGHRILDMGCGIGGPARTLVDNHRVHVVGLTTSKTHMRTARRINRTKSRWRSSIRIRLHDCQQPFPERGFDCAWSMNMLYHVADHQAMLANAHAVLAGGGRLLLDDWMLTRRATDADRKLLGRHFLSAHFAVRDELIPLVACAGFRLHHVVDLGHVGRTWLARHFKPQFNACFRPEIERDHGDDGRLMARDFLRAVGTTARLYREEKMTYCQLLAVKA